MAKDFTVTIERTDTKKRRAVKFSAREARDLARALLQVYCNESHASFARLVKPQDVPPYLKLIKPLFAVNRKKGA
jgi:hypothetical protein